MVTPTTSGTYAFNPTEDDWLGEAYSRLQIRGDQITYDKINDAERSANLMMAHWHNLGVNQFQLQLATFNLNTVAGIQTTGQIPASLLPTGTVQIFSSVLNVNATGGQPLSGYGVPMIRIARADYEIIPAKFNPGRPDRYFWDGANITLALRYMQLWPVPDVPSNYTVRVWVITRPQDVGGLTTLAPVGYEWMDAFCSGLAARLAEKYAPDLLEDKTKRATASLELAMSGGRERGATRFRVDPRSATSWR